MYAKSRSFADDFTPRSRNTSGSRLSIYPFRGKHWDEKAAVLEEVAPRSYRMRMENGEIGEIGKNCTRWVKTL